MFGYSWSIPQDYSKIDYGIDYSKMALRPGSTELQTVGVRDGEQAIRTTNSNISRTDRFVLSEQAEPVPKANFMKTCL